MLRLFMELTLHLQSPLTWIFFVLGALMGSFYNVCIYRIPRKIFFAKARSVCPSCGAPIPFWHNIPIISWFVLRGRAACCGSRISVQYAFVEIFSAILFATVYWIFPFVIHWEGGLLFDSPDLLRCIHALVFTSLLLICSVIDLEHQIIPDVLSLPMLLATPLVVFLHPDLDWKSALIGVLVGGGSLYTVAWLYYLIRRDYGLGMGDVKLLAAIGGWLGYQSILTTIFWGSILGSLVGVGVIIFRRKMDLKIRLPFGPFLATAAASYLLFGQFLAEYLITF
jgi:leader peptidase (prepilin peptidase) / N-methyltransferase